jgi:hypothetical protein
MRSSFSLLHWPLPTALLRLSTLVLVAFAAAFGTPALAQPARTTVEVIGDSQAQGLAAALQRKFMGNRQVRVVDRSKISTGLAFRGGYDWPTEAQALAAEHNADIVIVMFGANDRPPIRRDGEIDQALRDQFQKIYSERVHAIIRPFRDAGITVIWVGHPVVRDNLYTEDMAFLNRIYQSAASDEGARWLPTWDLFSTADGGYTAYGRGTDGMTQRLRADDGVHFTPAGYDLVANRLEPLIAARRAELTVGSAPSR